MGEQLANDTWGREIFMSSDGTIDTYTIVDTVNALNTVVTFNIGTYIQSWAYSIMEAIIPPGQGPGSYTPQTETSIGCTGDRPSTYNGTNFGWQYFDQTLGMMIYFIGYGSTGWIDGTGAWV